MKMPVSHASNTAGGAYSVGPCCLYEPYSWIGAGLRATRKGQVMVRAVLWTAACCIAVLHPVDNDMTFFSGVFSSLCDAQISGSLPLIVYPQFIRFCFINVATKIVLCCHLQVCAAAHAARSSRAPGGPDRRVIQHTALC